MLPALAFLFFLSHPRIQSSGIELQNFQGDPGFKAKVDGKDRTLVLCPRWPLSYMTTGDGKPHSVALAGKPLLNATFQPLDQASMFEGADGVLGIDALRKVCLGFDALWERMEPLSSTKIGLEGAKAYFAKLPAWGGPSKVVKVPLARSFSGVPTIKANIGGVPTTLIMTLSCYNNMLDKTVKGTPIVKPDEWSFMPSLALAGASPGWAAYATLSDWDA